MNSPRLRYNPVKARHLDRFHELVTDPHVRRYLMDGQVFPREWSEERIADSEDLFRRRGVGLWLATELATGELAGFCGFLEVPSVCPEPQLVYALFERHTGKGYATEMAAAAIAAARTQPGFDDVFAGVDAANTASRRVLEKLAFMPIRTLEGAFGEMMLYRLEHSRAAC